MTDKKALISEHLKQATIALTLAMALTEGDPAYANEHANIAEAVRRSANAEWSLKKKG